MKQAARQAPAVLAGLLALAAPAATAAETLVLTCEVCTELIVAGKRVPESRRRGP